MKLPVPVMTTEFLRGLLFATFAYGFWEAVNMLQVGSHGYDPLQLTLGTVFFLVELAISLALLVRAPRAGRFAMIYFSLILAMQVAGAFYRQLKFPPQDPSPLGLSFLFAFAFQSVMIYASYLLNTQLRHEAILDDSAEHVTAATS